MQILSLNFFIYTVGGVWRPIEWSSTGAKLLYNVFTFITIVPLYFLMLTQFMDIVLIVDNLDDFATNSLMFMTIVGVCCKATVAVVRRSEIIDLVQILLKDPCKPRNEAELAIQAKFDEFIRSSSIKYSLLATGSITSFTIRSLLNVLQGHLPYRVWLPYDSDESLMFWITSIHQIITLIFATIINVGTETLIFGLFLQTCVQLEIFESRLHKLIINKTAGYREYFSRASSDGKETIIAGYIRHHLSIFHYAKTLNSIFNQVLFFQFFGSILVLCTSVYYMSTHISGSEAATLPAYTVCMFVQIFVYCWSGNEVILKATVAVLRRNTIIDLVQILLKDPCKPRNETELVIQTKCNEFIRSISIKYSLLATCSVTGVTIRSVLNVMEGQLPYRVWLPYDSDEPSMFWITSILQIISIIYCTIINVGTETLMFGLFLQTCIQLEIFENRLRRLVINKTSGYREYLPHKSLDTEEEMNISGYINHHLCIFNYAKTLNRIFSQVLFCQFFASILILCTSVYYMSMIKGSEAATLIVYTFCMSVQIFIYCWSGNEVITKSTSIGNAVYEMNWTLLSISEKRDLLMIMKRSSMPIKFTSSFLITFSLESYSNILKTSYSAFNILQRS
ncbi:odorant receptor 42b isoform X2 [Ooceraea biroi]|nr:odorant receptor 42b isoform X2 [Ooceraea biroi]XP_019887006.1 odorant receptor 42b isoform X2 [Ooceraea biroi]